MYSVQSPSFEHWSTNVLFDRLRSWCGIDVHGKSSPHIVGRNIDRQPAGHPTTQQCTAICYKVCQQYLRDVSIKDHVQFQLLFAGQASDRSLTWFIQTTNTYHTYHKMDGTRQNTLLHLQEHYNEVQQNSMAPL